MLSGSGRTRTVGRWVTLTRCRACFEPRWSPVARERSSLAAASSKTRPRAQEKRTDKGGASGAHSEPRGAEAAAAAAAAGAAGAAGAGRVALASPPGADGLAAADAQPPRGAGGEGWG